MTFASAEAGSDELMKYHYCLLSALVPTVEERGTKKQEHLKENSATGGMLYEENMRQREWQG